ncbi:amino acid adenylation domain-containing protein [Candidatus Nitrospira bockiana]
MKDATETSAAREGVYVFPMSFAQQRLWFLAQLEPDSSSYHMPVALRIVGALDVAAMEQSLREIIRRHEVLRTTCATIDGQPVQVIGADPSVPLSIVDLRGTPEADREAAVERLARQEAQRPFDLTKGPLLRVHLVRLGGLDQVLLLIIHHIIFDGWSAAILAQEFAAIYPALAAGRPSSLPPLPIQYADFAHWQRQWLQGPMRDRELAYWRDRLAGAPDRLELPTDRPRPAVQRYRGARYRFALPSGVVERLESLAREQGATLFMALLAGFQILLGRYSGQRDFCIGTPIANRPRLELEGLIGFFVNTLVLRARLEGHPSTLEVLGRARETVLEAQAHQDLPFEQLVEALQPARALSHSPLVQVMFALEHRVPPLEIPGLSIHLFDVDPGAAPFELSLEIVPGPSEYQAILEYSTDLFEEGTIRRMANHFLLVLDGMTARPEVPVDDLPLLTEEERAQFLIASSALDTPHSALPIPLCGASPALGTPHSALRTHPCVHELIEAQAVRTPEAIAVALEDRALTYRELDARANRLARELRRRGVGPDVLVGLCLERSIEMIVGLLGILKAGGAYVPIDPTHPKARTAAVFNDAGVRLVLTQERCLAQLPDAGIECLCLDRDWSVIARHPGEPGASGVQPENLAYVLYTSGSTGRPKGVLITHGSLASYVRYAREAFGLEPSDRVLQFASVTFDASAEEIYPCLASGAALVLRTDGMLESVPAFVRACAHWGITVLDLPTMYWHELTARLAGEVQVPPALRLTIIGGEQARADRLALWAGSVGRACRLLNTYGPTETTIVATCADLTGAAAADPVPIGRAVAQAQAYVLNGTMQPVPIGVPGELYIGGAGLARGYLNRPDLTAETFVPDPFGAAPGGRLYRTGDRVRRRADGQLEFLGRIDHQIKLRGLRIELGEIEAQLRAHPAVRDAVVLLREESGARRLVAYVVGEPAGSANELRRFLQDRLPDYMVPAAFVFLSALPQTPAGKVDRSALPAPAILTRREGAPRLPSTRAEAVLAEIWSGVLGKSDITVHDNFFELGGDSILSLQVVARARDAGLRLTPRQIFQHQTIAELASVAGEPGTRAVDHVSPGAEVPLTPIQRWFFEQEIPNRHHWNQALLLEGQGEIRVAALEEAVRALVEHHDALRLRFVREGDRWRQRYAADRPTDSEPAVVRVDLSDVPAEQQRARLEAAIDEWQRRLHLAEGPVLRAVWFDLGPRRSGRLLLVIHHLVVDAVSWWILLEDLQAAYGQRLRGEAVRLPAKTASFQEWAGRLIEEARSPTVQAEAPYWLGLLQAARPVPLDDPTGARTESTTAVVMDVLNEEETRALLQDAAHAYRMRVDEVLLTALAQTLVRWTGDARVLIEVEGHGREELSEEIDVSRTVGWFTTLHPVGLDVSSEAGPDEALKKVKEQIRRVPRGGIGYGLLRYLSDSEAAGRLHGLPQARISFNYLGQWDQTFAGSSLLTLAAEATGADRDPAGSRGYDLEIDAVIVGGRLQVRWSYSSARHREETIQDLSRGCMERLRALVGYCRRPEAGGLTPSDVPLARLDQPRLDVLFGADRDVEDVYPLTPLQQGLLFHALYAPDTGVYVEQVSCTVEGRLDLAAFRQAWQQVVDRHPALRTAFLWQGEGVSEPLQVVRRRVGLPLTCLDWRDLSEEEQRARLQEWLETDRKAGFDCARAPLLRLTVIRQAERLHRVVWTHHHLLLDGWCVPVLLKEVLAGYEASLRGERAIFPPSRPYRDFVAWLQRQDPNEAERHWREALAGVTAPTPLGIDRPDVGGQAGGVGSHVVTLSSSTTRALTTFVQRHQLTLSTLMQGAWALLLSRYSGDPDVVFGVTVSGRSAPLHGIEAMVGLLINTLPLRVRVPATATVLSWLKELLAQSAAVHHYEHTPLTSIQSWSQIPKGQPLFESLLVVENYPTDPTVFAGSSELHVSEVTVDDQTNYPLTITVLPGAELSLRCSYDRRRCDEESVRRMLAHVARLLEELSRNPGLCLGEISLPTEQERHLLGTWNATERAYPLERCVHELIEAQAEQTPEACAVVFEGQRLTYRELNARANQVAHHLRRHGAGPDVLVGICLERSLEMVVGLLGILKAGAAYVPIDPDHPRERIAFMLQDMAAPLLVSCEALAEALPPHPARIICLDRNGSRIERESTDDPNVPLSLQHLAYTIYTSGSTGRPKGAGIPHGGLLNRLLWMQEQYRLQPGDRVLQKTPFSFDVSVWEFFWPLMTGACLVVPRPGDHRHPDRLVELIVRHAVTTLHFVPPMLQAFLDTPGVNACRSIRRVICSGEALPAELQRRFFERMHPEAELHNLYGPTEASIDVTAWACRRDDPGASVPIGSPIANTQIHLLDPLGHPVPVGVAGELYIGGVGLARGYHGRPDLTAEKFLPDPFTSRPGARLYRTGDLARRRADGAIEFLGRLDHQVKIRGFRVELGEIEARLLEHPSVGEAVVIAREDHPGQKRLVAYVVGRGAAPDGDELREWLTRHLPDYMVPAFLVPLDALPLSANGKVARRALPAPDLSSIRSRDYVAPRTQVEGLLAEIWAQVLHLDRIGIHDNFFELGGDSIVTLQIVARARQRGLTLTPRDLFEHPTIAEAAAVAVQEGERTPTDHHPGQDVPEVPLTEQELGQLLEEIR